MGLASLLWAAVVVGICFVFWMDVQELDAGDLTRSALLLWIVPSVLLLAFGHGIAWAIRGFHTAGGSQ